MLDFECIEQWVLENQQQLFTLASQLFDHPETAQQERFACSTLCNYLEEHGFRIEKGVGELETAFVARWGERGPSIGLLAEYDALPNSYQPVQARQYPASDRPGHACGHHLIGAASVVAAAAVRTLAQRLNIPLQITVYGCPAEETMRGKVIMARHGVFSNLDAAVIWHPEDFNGPAAYRCKAMTILHYKFTGISAHAAQAPHLGRSALDACELMNVGANYLREHVERDCSFHYAYLDAPTMPNLVPSHAAVIYYVRGVQHKQVESLVRRLGDIADGAALMAGVCVEKESVLSVPETRPNLPLTSFADEVLKQLHLDPFTRQEQEFAAELLVHSGLSCKEQALSERKREFDGQVEQRSGSSDVAAVSRLVPTVMLRNTCVPTGVPQHHWAFAASCGSSAGLKGAGNGVKFMAALILAMADTPEILEKARQFWEEESAEKEDVV